MNNSSSESRLLYETISNIEIEIKKIIKDDVLDNQPKHKTYSKIKQVIMKYCSSLPSKYQREIAENAYRSADKFYNEYYHKVSQWYNMALVALLAINVQLLNKEKTTTRRELYHYIVEQPEHAFDKYPFLNDYKRSIQRRTLELAKNPMLSFSASRNTSLFAKAELQVRYENQMEMIEEIKNKGVRLCWISSHADCSERCAKWQGKLVDMNAPAINSNFETGEVIDGHKVYSLTAITSQIDKYGYFNNIIVGFNCRHRLIPYTTRSKASKSYRAKQRKKEYNVNENMRKIERTIRDTRKQAYLIKDLDYKKYKELNRLINNRVEFYKKYAESKNVQTLMWRTKIAKGDKKIMKR